MSDTFKLLGGGNTPQGIKRIRQVLFENKVTVYQEGTTLVTKEQIKGIA